MRPGSAPPTQPTNRTGILDVDDPTFNDIPPGIPLAFGVFFAGFVVLGIASLGRAMSKRQ